MSNIWDFEGTEFSDGGSGKLHPGVYDATVKRAMIKKNKTGSKSIIWELDVDGKDFYHFGGTIFKANGEPVQGFFHRDLAEPMYLVGMSGKPVMEKSEWKTKNGSIEVEELPELVGKEYKVAIGYDQEGENLIVKKFFNKDGLSAKEVKAGATEPKQIKFWEKETEKAKPAKKNDVPEIDINDEDIPF